MLKNSPREGRKLALAVVAVQIPAVVFLVVNLVMHATALRAYITVFVLGLYNKVNGIVLGGEFFEKVKLVHSSFF